MAQQGRLWIAVAVVVTAAFGAALGTASGRAPGSVSAASDDVVIHVPVALDGESHVGVTPPSPTASHVTHTAPPASATTPPASATASPASPTTPHASATAPPAFPTTPHASATAPPASPTVSPTPGGGHHAGDDCMSCHDEYAIAGTVYDDTTGASLGVRVPLVLIAPDGGELVTAGTDGDGNLADPFVPDGVYLVQLDAVTSKTWHAVPGQGSCNTCHVPGGNGSAERTKQLDTYHSRLPADNACTHCHHFPETQALDDLMTLGVLSPAVEQPAIPGSQVRIGGAAFAFDPADHAIETVRPDIFAPGYFSMFDAILAVALANDIEIVYEWDESRATHFITSVNGYELDFWYHFSYDTGSVRGNESELSYRRANRWDETLWRPGAWVQLVAGEDLERLKAEFLEEIEREHRDGHVVPSVRFQINPSQYQGNPPSSGRITVRRQFSDVTVTAHDQRSVGYPSPHSKPFQPGVVTSHDIVLSLMDQGALDAVTSVFYSNLAGDLIDSFHVVELGFPGIGAAHASGSQGFVFVTENGAFNDLPNGADPKLHMTADINVIHAPDFSYWRWIELGNPYYEGGGRDSAIDPMIVEDNDALGRGFNLHRPEVNADTGDVAFYFNVLEPGRFTLTVRDMAGGVAAELIDGRIDNVGMHRIAWPAGRDRLQRSYSGELTDRNAETVPEISADTVPELYAEMTSGRHSQVRAVPSQTRPAKSSQP